MKLLRFPILFLFFGFALCLSQNKTTETISAKGQFRENYRTIPLNETIKNSLFVLEKGNLILPETGFFLNLSEEDAKKLGTSDVLIIPIVSNGSGINYQYNKDFKFELISIPEVENVYYSKKYEYKMENGTEVIVDETTHGKAYKESIFERPSVKDIVDWSEFTYHEDFRDIQKWIGKLNSQEEVTVRSQKIYERSDGGSSDGDLEKRTLAELARHKLDYVENHFKIFGKSKHTATQEDWQKWIDDFLTSKISDKIVRPNNNFYQIKFKESVYSYWIKDSSAEKLIKISSQINYSNFNDQQIISFNPKKLTFSEGKIYNTEQNEAKDFVGFYAHQDIITTINNDFIFAKYKFVEKGKDEKDFYKQIEIKNLKPSLEKFNEKKKKQEYIIKRAKLTKDFLYILYHEKDKTDYHLICFDAHNGKVLVRENLNEVLRSRILEIVPFKEFDPNNQYFTLLISTNDGVHHLKLNEDLVNLQDRHLETNYYWHPYFYQNENDSFYFQISDQALKFKIINDDGIKNISTAITGIISGEEFSLLKVGDNFRIFYGFKDSFVQGIRTILLDGKTFQQIGSPTTIFSEIPVETSKYENRPAQLNAFFMNDEYYVCYNINTTQYLVKLKL
jgi:hypothetical protein